MNYVDDQYQNTDQFVQPGWSVYPSMGGEFLSFEKVKNALNMGEAGDADLLFELYADRIIYDHAEGGWFVWSGHYWQPDTTGDVYRLVTHELASQYLHAAAEAQRSGNDQLSGDLLKRAAALRNKKRADNILFLAARNEGIALTGSEWDRDPWVIGVSNGVIDLKTAAFRPGHPGDFIRSHAPTTWTGLDTPAPRWEKFLTEIFGGDEELIKFLITGHNFSPIS